MPRKKKEKIEIKEEPIEEKVASTTMNDLADCVVEDQALVARLNAMGFKTKNPKGFTYREAMMCSLIANAVRGDLKSNNAVLEMMQSEKKPPLVSYLGGEQSEFED